MDLTARIVGNIMMELMPEAANPFEAVDLFSSRIYKRIIIKSNAQIDCSDELEIYLFINGYKSKIAEMVFDNIRKERSKNAGGNND